MNEAHLHLLITHVPVIGTVIGTLVLAYARAFDRTEAMRIGLGILVLSGLAAFAVFMTGEGAEELIEGQAGISHAVIERHEESATFALAGAAIVGVVSAAGLWMSRRRLPRWFGSLALGLALVSTLILGWTANLGGQINHPEIRSEAAAAPDGEEGGEIGHADED